mmetsp:Transcript_8036/g.21408  ORF Transcript_8036/g.21408 Transcript_8036/m.21408 type:complete len:200 (+) Transcript_8036:2769-3368(+)
MGSALIFCILHLACQRHRCAIAWLQNCALATATGAAQPSLAAAAAAAQPKTAATSDAAALVAAAFALGLIRVTPFSVGEASGFASTALPGLIALMVVLEDLHQLVEGHVPIVRHACRVTSERWCYTGLLAPVLAHLLPSASVCSIAPSTITGEGLHGGQRALVLRTGSATPISVSYHTCYGFFLSCCLRRARATQRYSM